MIHIPQILDVQRLVDIGIGSRLYVGHQHLIVRIVWSHTTGNLDIRIFLHKFLNLFLAKLDALWSFIVPITDGRLRHIADILGRNPIHLACGITAWGSQVF